VVDAQQVTDQLLHIVSGQRVDPAGAVHGVVRVDPCGQQLDQLACTAGLAGALQRLSCSEGGNRFVHSHSVANEFGEFDINGGSHLGDGVVRIARGDGGLAHQYPAGAEIMSLAADVVGVSKLVTQPTGE